MAGDHGRLLRNAVEWAGSMTVHLVNLTIPMLMRANIHELLPSAPQQVRVQLPKGAKAARVEFLVSAARPAVEQGTGFVTLNVPSVLDHEVIAIDLA